MLRLIGVITIIALLASVVVFIEHYFNGNFISEVLYSETLSILATILGLQLATASFLLTSLSTFELRAGLNVFDESRKEIKENLYLLVFTFLVALVVLVIDTTNMSFFAQSLKKVCVVGIILLAIFSFIELVKALFSFEQGIRK